LADGLRLRFEPSIETLSSIVQAVDAERHCCRFLRFTITVEPDEGAVIVDLHGPTGHPRVRRSVARGESINLAVFALAAFFEIAGCFAFWIWVRRGATPFVVVLGVASLVGFALALTRVDSTFAGTAYAAYGGI